MFARREAEESAREAGRRVDARRPILEHLVGRLQGIDAGGQRLLEAVEPLGQRLVEVAKGVDDQLELGIHGVVVVDSVVLQDLAPSTNLLAHLSVDDTTLNTQLGYNRITQPQRKGGLELSRAI